jgi:putative alpha-1,2-mannosidase
VCVKFKSEEYELGMPTDFGAYSNNYPVRGARSGEQVQCVFGLLDHRFEVITVLVLTGSESDYGALLEFSPSPSSAVTSILSRVGVSFISTDQACSTAEEEIPDYDFEKVRSDARAQWNDVLGRVKVRFGDAGERTTAKQKELVEHFYSSVSLSVNSGELAMNELYRTHIAPADCESPLLAVMNDSG